MKIPGKRVRRTRWVHTPRYAVAVEVDAVFPEFDPTELCYESEVVRHLQEVEARANAGDVEWLKRHGKVYEAIEAA